YSEREFEKILRDVVGLSQQEAKTVVSRGFRQLIGGRDGRSEELKQMAALLEHNENIFNQQKR
ncbi:MAG: hypothetical protein ACXW03_01575, partial [Methylobacter sp.]